MEAVGDDEGVGEVLFTPERDSPEARSIHTNWTSSFALQRLKIGLAERSFRAAQHDIIDLVVLEVQGW